MEASSVVRYLEITPVDALLSYPIPDLPSLESFRDIKGNALG
jgi:hypothetical protein